METISLPAAQLIMQVLGLPGLVFIIWHFDNKRLDKQREIYEAEQAKHRRMYEAEQAKQREEFAKLINLTLAQYRDDVSSIRRLYENNADLAKDYEKLSREHVDTIRLNTQSQQALLDWLKNRTPCHLHLNGKG